MSTVLFLLQNVCHVGGGNVGSPFFN